MIDRAPRSTLAIAAPPGRLDIGGIAGLDLDSPPRGTCLASVVIPVRDEQTTLGACLQALAGQLDLAGRPLAPASYEVILLANNCRDGSAALARAFAARHPELALHVAEIELPPARSHVGWARRLLMDVACRRLERLGRPRGLIATTDADTRVAPTWLAATLREVAQGADAVGGRILADPLGVAALEPATRARYLGDVAYKLLAAELESLLDPDPGDPWPRHHQHTGASFALTVEAYRRVDGLPPLPESEDVALFQALRTLGAAFRHSPLVRVVTSARRRRGAVSSSGWRRPGSLSRPCPILLPSS